MGKTRGHGSRNLSSQLLPQGQCQPASRKSHEGSLVAFLRRQGHDVKRKHGTLTVIPKVRDDY